MSNLYTAWKSLGVRPCTVLLPAPHVDPGKWAVVACDQYTSQPDYWVSVEQIVGNSPSTLRLMLPEIHLDGPDEAQRIASIHSAMRTYLDSGVLRPMQGGAVLVRRTVGSHTRTGLVLAVDLDCYDYSKDSCSLIRATEGTIVERIPPRMRIRKNAPLEMPHILVLIDDPNRTVIEPLAAREDFATAYDFDLMQSGGHLYGRFVPESALCGVRDALNSLLLSADGQYKKGDALLFAVGDGNHSLATAKACWEQVKQTLSEEEAQQHPARYALCEIENVHDEGIVFEPIHRLLFGCGNAKQAITGIASVLAAQNGDAFFIELDKAESSRAKGAHVLPYVIAGENGALCVPHPVQQLPVGTLQLALDAYLTNSPAVRIDYVHGDDIVSLEGTKPGNIGFFLPPMAKEELFKTVVLDGALPRKTFSMGEAHEKRYYMEARLIAR